MSCKNIEEKIFAAIDNQYLLQSDNELKKHLQECSTCKALYEQLLFEDEYLIDAGASFRAPAGIEEKIISRLPSIAKAKPRKSYGWLRYAAAACIVLLIAIIFYPEPRVAKVEAIQGRLQKKTILGWRDLEKGDSVQDKAVLRTLANSKATIVFEEGNYLRLDPESSLYLGARVHKELDHIYRIEYGSIWAKVHHNYDGEFYIETPNALIIRVLGTEFNVRIIPETKQKEE